MPTNVHTKLNTDSTQQQILQRVQHRPVRKPQLLNSLRTVELEREIALDVLIWDEKIVEVYVGTRRRSNCWVSLPQHVKTLSPILAVCGVLPKTVTIADTTTLEAETLKQRQNEWEKSQAGVRSLHERDAAHKAQLESVALAELESDWSRQADVYHEILRTALGRHPQDQHDDIRTNHHKLVAVERREFISRGYFKALQREIEPEHLNEIAPLFEAELETA